MSNPFNVLRYSLLGLGVVVGTVHQYRYNSAEEKLHAAKQFRKEEKLIKNAKEEFAKLHKTNAPGGDVGSINWDDANLDFGKALETVILKLN